MTKKKPLKKKVIKKLLKPVPKAMDRNHKLSDTEWLLLKYRFENNN